MQTISARYELGPVIGRGGMAEVLAGRDTRLERPVAIKLLRADLAGNPDIRRRFESEALLAARLFHPNVVAVFDSGETEDGVPFIVMERLPGSTLQDRLRQGTLSMGEAQELASQVLAALHAAHSAGVLHRDVKPGNILLGPGGQWKVGDFGIAKALELSEATAAATTILMGTPAYLAPERLHGAPATVQSDLYSFGVVMYEALTGRKPLETPLVLARPDVDAALAAAIEQCLSRDPAQRPPSASSLGFGPSPDSPSPDSPSPHSPSPDSEADRTVVSAPVPTEVIRGAAAERLEALRPAGIRPIRTGAVRQAVSRRTWSLLAAVAAVAVALLVIISLPTGHTSTTTTTTTTTIGTTSGTTSGPGGLPPAFARAVANLEKQVTP